MFSHSMQSTSDESVYSVHAELVGDAIEQGRVSTVVSARWRSEATDGQDQSAHFFVETDEENRNLRLIHDGEVLGSVDLDVALPDESADPADENEALGPIFEAATRLSSVVSALDPVVGCLLKGAAMSVASQTIRCWQATEKADSFGDRARSTAACLRSNGMKTGWNFIKRVGRCLISLGLD